MLIAGLDFSQSYLTLKASLKFCVESKARPDYWPESDLLTEQPVNI